MHALLSPDHEGPDHRMLRGMSHGRAAIGRPEKSQRSDTRLSENAHGASLEAASLDWLEALLQRPRRFGPVRKKKSWKDSCIPMRWNSSGASSLFFILFLPGWSPAPSSWRLSNACFGWKR